MKDWFDEACWHAPAVLVLDNLDRMIAAEVEVRLLSLRRVFEFELTRDHPAARRLLPCRPSRKHLPLARPSRPRIPPDRPHCNSTRLDEPASASQLDALARRDGIAARTRQDGSARRVSPAYTCSLETRADSRVSADPERPGQGKDELVGPYGAEA